MQEKKSRSRSFIALTSTLKLFQPKLCRSSTALMGMLGDGEGSWVSGRREAVRKSAK